MCKCLEVDSVIKSFGDNDVLTDVFLRCNRGERIAIFGWNGSGKSTLLKIIFGTMRAERSFIRIDGEVQNRPAYCSRQIAYLPQHDFLPPNIRITDAIDLYIPPAEREAFLNDKNLSNIKESSAKHLSGGELRYLEIKLILFSYAPYILLDEPFNGISPVCCESVRELIHKASQTKGIIMTDHNFREIHKLATRITLLDNGCLKEIKDKTDLASYGYYK